MEIRYFQEREFNHWHHYSEGSPTEWAAERGATHTLHTLDGNRPAKIMKTVAYIGVDETDKGDIDWEKWMIRH